MSDEVEAPGWSAIDTAVSMRYPDQTPHQFTSQVPYELDKQNPLPAVCVWEAMSPQSWHYVGYGLSELFEKQSPIPDLSGFGIELTLRLPRADGEEKPPVWGARLIQALGHHCLSEGAGFDSGHCIDLGAPITPEGDSAITGLCCIPDPMLRQIPTPNGTVLFLQLVGLTTDELTAFRDMSLEAKVSAVADLDASGLTDPARRSWFEDDETGRVLRRYKLGVGL